MKRSLTLLVLFGLWLMSRPGLALDESKIIDLTYPYDEHTISWPTAKPYALEVVAAQKTDAGFWYAANNICLAEHSGTHMDAPIHFAEGKRTASEVPVTQLVGPAVVIDVSAKGRRGRRLPCHRSGYSGLGVHARRDSPRGARAHVQRLGTVLAG